MIKSKSKTKTKTKDKSKTKGKSEPKAPVKAAKAAAPAKRLAQKADWSATIKKALEDKSAPPTWPGSGDAWKRKPKVG